MKNKRKQLIVDKDLQYRIIGLVVSAGLSVCLVAIAGLYYLTTRMLAVLEQLDLASPAVPHLIGELGGVFTIFILLVSVAVLASWVFAAYLSNRIAGPIYQIGRVLEAHQAGDKEVRVHLRQNDYFKPLAEQINKVLDGK